MAELPRQSVERPVEEKRIWGQTEIAEYYGINRQLARKWSQHSAFPEPYEKLAQGPVWLPDQVTSWGDAHGRRKGGGPGIPKGAPRPRK